MSSKENRLVPQHTIEYQPLSTHTSFNKKNVIKTKIVKKSIKTMWYGDNQHFEKGSEVQTTEERFD